MKKIIRRCLNKLNFDIRQLAEVEENWHPFKFNNFKTIIDVGVANCTDKLIHKFPNSKHILIEPNKDFNPEINKNYKNINHTIINMLVVLKRKICHRNLKHISNSSLLKISDETKYLEEITVEVDKLDNLILPHDISKPALLKIDIEGFELHALKGAKETLKYVDVIIIEVSCNNPNNLSEVFSFMKSVGFDQSEILYSHRWNNIYHAIDVMFANENINLRKIRMIKVS